MWDLAASLDKAEDVVDEQQHILVFLIPEVFRHGQPRQSHPHTHTGRFVHLAEYQGGFGGHAALPHLPPQVAEFHGRTKG